MTTEEMKRYILDNFQYHQDGTITRTDRKNSNGSIDKDGYLILKVKKKQFKAHRIAWLLCYGDFPKTELDHINRDRTDNRIENLRECTRHEQLMNRDVEPNKDTGVVGIHVDRTKGLKKKYAFCHKGKTYRFYSLEEARKARENVRKVM